MTHSNRWARACALVIVALASMPWGDARAQLDTKHWIPALWAAEQSTSAAGNHYLILTTPETDPVAVTVTDGAGNAVWSGTVSNASPHKELLGSFSSGSDYDSANPPAAGNMLFGLAGLNTVSDAGLVVSAAKPVYANIRNITTSQATSLTGKGKKALGTRFRAGVMRGALGSQSYRGVFISVMATQPVTTVTFSDVKGGIVFNGTSASGSPATTDDIEVVLDQDESYVIGIVFPSYDGSNNNINDVNGTLINADKPIAVASGGWLTGPGASTGQDAGIDQIVPENLAGTEYVLMRGGAANGNLMESPMPLAVEDDTQVFVNGSGTPACNLDAGDYCFLDGHYSSGSNMLVTASKPVLMFQSMGGSSSDATPGFNFIPPLGADNVTSVDKIHHVEQLGSATLGVVARAGAEVLVNGSPIGVSADAVTGSSDWVTYRRTGLTGDVAVTSTDEIAVALFNVSGDIGAAGYFSGFPPTEVDLDGDSVPDGSDNCPDDSNPGQGDSDDDGVGNACDLCPDDPSKDAPGGCGCGTADVDVDPANGTLDCLEVDNCPDDDDKLNPGFCGCGVPDTDGDGDGTPNCNDDCPGDPDKVDPGVCDCGTPDTDFDFDGTPDCNDDCPTDNTRTEPGPCGCHDAACGENAVCGGPGGCECEPGWAGDPNAGCTVVDNLTATLADAVQVDSGAPGASPGDTLRLTAQIANPGTGTAEDVTFTLSPTAEGSLVVGSVTTSRGAVTTGNGAGDSGVVVAIGDLGPGISATITADVALSASMTFGVTSVSHQGDVTGTNVTSLSTDDPDTGPSGDPTVTAVTRTVDLSLSKVASTSFAAPGQTVEYALEWLNVGDDQATGVVLTETVPPHTVFDGGASAAGWSCSDGATAGTGCTLNVDDISPSGGGSAVFAVTVVPVSNDDATVTNTASIAGNEDDPAPGNDTDAALVTLVADPALALAKTDGGQSAAPGSPFSWTLTVENTGNRVASSVTLTETVPIGTTKPSAGPWSCSGSAAGSTCTLALADIQPGDDESATFTVQVDPTHPSGRENLANTASVSAAGGASDSGGLSTPLAAAPDLDVKVLAYDASAVPGEVVYYEVSARNNGSQPSGNVVMQAVVPPGTSFRADISNPDWTCAGDGSAGDTCTVSRPAVQVNNLTQADFAVDVLAPAAAGQETVELTVEVTDDGSQGPDLNPLDNTETEAVPLDAAPDLVLLATGPAVASTGDGVVYELLLGNDGDQNASGVTVSFTVPAQTTFDADASSPGWSCSDGAAAGTPCTLALGDVTVLDTPLVAAALTVDSAVPAGVEDVTFTADAADDGSSGALANPGDDSDSVVTGVTAAPDLAVDKQDGGAPATPGGQLSYTITVDNHGDQGATGIVLTETVPAHTTFAAGASDPWLCTPDGSAGSTCQLTVGGLAAGNDTQRTFTVTVDASVPSGLTTLVNQVAAGDDGANGVDPAGDNADDEITPLEAAPDLVVTLDDGGATAQLGDSFTYTVGYSNAGDQDATGVVLTETVPPQTIFFAGGSTAGWSCPDGATSGTTCTLAVGALAAGAGGSATFTVVVEDPLSPGVTGLANTASIADDGANGADQTPADNSATANSPIEATPLLDVSKRDGGAAMTPGNRVVYTIDWEHLPEGTQHAQGVTLVETVPTHATFSTAGSSPGWSCADGAAAGSTCSFALGTVNIGVSGSTQFAVVIDEDAPTAALSNAVTLQDDGQNATGEVVSATGGTSATITPCHTDYLFTEGTGPWTTDNPALWKYVPSLGGWKTGGEGNIPPGRQLGRINLDVTVPAVAQGGPRPELIVTYRLRGNPNPDFDAFAVCLDDDDCHGQTLSNAFSSTQNAASPTALQTARVPLGAYAGGSVRVSLLFDTITSGNPGNVPGLFIDRVVVASDPEGDGFDGAAPDCDRCWDGDVDGYAHPQSPGLASGACTFETPDCDDEQTNINPGAAEICTAGSGDEDCDGLHDGADTDDCGSEDCADGIDNNQDGAVDCADNGCATDPFCTNACGIAFTFDSGPGAWVAADNDPDGDGGTRVFEHGKSAAHGGEEGWSTVLDGTVGSANTAGSPFVRATLTRTVVVPTGVPSPAIEVRYSLQGDAATGKDVFGVCFNTVPSQCNASAPAAVTAYRTSTGTGPSLATAVIPLPPGSAGSVVSLVLFYDTVDDLDNANPGVFVGDVLVRSDIDEDGVYEAAPPQCDHCVDADGDEYGSPDVPASFVLSCPFVDLDCDDGDPATFPAGQEACGAAGDNNCDGLTDTQDPLCSECGDGEVTAGEQCDDHNEEPGDGCDEQCQVEAGAFHITELHLSTLGGGTGEQWFELYNGSTGPVHLLQLGLTFESQTGAQQSFASGCAPLPGRAGTIAPGDFYVIALGPTNTTDGLENLDAECSGAFQLSAGGDILRLRDKDGRVVDEVDFRAFTCELGADTQTGVARSFELMDPATRTAGTNDGPAVWCLSGPGDPVTASLNHRGSPGAAGTCGELTCDSIDDDCDGDTDEGLPDSDSDGFCDAVDCDPGVATCGADCDTDLDGDGVPLCRDGCVDADGDGWGEPGGAATSTCKTLQGVEAADCDDTLSFVSPEGTEELGNGSCTNGVDEDCDGMVDCTDETCSGSDECVAESCDGAEPISCGDVVTVEPITDSFPCNPAGGNDAVLQLMVPTSQTVRIEVQNPGSAQFVAHVLEGTCTDNACDGAVAVAASSCTVVQAADVAASAGTAYFVVVERSGTCAGAVAEAVVSVSCGEVCTGGVDEDLDGDVDCADEDCATDAACTGGDFDGDGVPTADEQICGTDPLDPLSKPSTDDLLNVDGDGQLNCIDGDDDGDQVPDAVELAQCTLNPTAKNDPTIKPGAPLNCQQAGVDADCNGTFDTLETECGAVEQQCGDGVDNDTDGDADCADTDCVAAAQCAGEDFDGDGVINSIELACNQSPLDGDATPGPLQAADTDGDGQPNCADEDDDGDGFPDVQETLCASDPLDPGATPANTDGDVQCDDIDDDDDNDGFADAVEIDCGSDSKVSTSTPVDAAHDLDGDGTCDARDFDLDGDGWGNGIEKTCGTDPTDGDASPTSLGFDGDNDKICDALDPDDDNDGWTDDKESLCKTNPKDATSLPEDVDLDGVCDIFDKDADEDGWPNALEEQCGTDPFDIASNPGAAGQDDDGDTLCDAVDADDDGDGWSDVSEGICQTDKGDDQSVPTDTDGDLICDTEDEDDDGDGWTDATEALCTTDPLDEGSIPEDADGDGLCDAVDEEADPDGDGWTNLEEERCGSDTLDGESVPTDLDDDSICDPLDDDMDGDGWLDDDEQACGKDPASGEDHPSDTDADGSCNALDNDDDGDNVSDADEETCGTNPLSALSKPLGPQGEDLDLDGKLSCVDDDDDGDGILDADEALIGSNPLSTDSDHDGIPDAEENADLDGEVDPDETDPSKADTDGDGLDDLTERDSCYLGDGAAQACQATLGYDADTDGDGLKDGEEDANGDGLTTGSETNPLVDDTDEDGFDDGTEVGCATDPLDADFFPTDKDDSGVCDGAEIDTDKDGIADGVETYCGTDPNSFASAPSLDELDDFDGDGSLDCKDTDDDDDGYSDADELDCGHDTRDDADHPTDDDVLDIDDDEEINCADLDDDGDGLQDDAEKLVGSSKDDQDSDDDGLSDGQELFVSKTDPTEADTDGDGVQDGTELGVTEGTKDTGAGFVPDDDPSTVTDPLSEDTDGDLLKDGEEDLNGNGRYEPEAGETDPRSASDGLRDTDGDGLSDLEEKELGTKEDDPDSDGDGLDDKLEVYVYESDPLNPDTDGGGVLDGVEVEAGTSPTDPADDYSKAVLSGDNVFGCAQGSGTPPTAGLLILLLALGLLWSRRRDA